MYRGQQCYIWTSGQLLLVPAESQYPAVSWNRLKMKWKAEYQSAPGARARCLGYFDTERQADQAQNRGGRKSEDRLEQSSPRPTASNGYKKSKNQFRGWSNDEIDTLYNMLVAGLRGSWQEIADALNAAMAPALGADTGTLNPKTLNPNCR